MIEEFERIVLLTDIPEHGLKRGDVGTVVMVHGGGEAYEVEFMALDGDTVAVTTLGSGQRRRVHPGEIASARAFEAA
jgi:hypothetical protein